MRRLSPMDKPPPPHQKATGPDGDLMGGSLLMGSKHREKWIDGEEKEFQLWM